ncbi:MAG TPA: ABC transporter ATP-binding protein [Pseudonocardiaceae bacterium]|jgi:ABC-2 type transport system ATP-binding protein
MLTPVGGGGGVVVRDVRRSFGDVRAVRGMSLQAAPGEVTALVGPNGAGKTTLLLVLATLLTPDAGEVRVAGRDPVTEPDAVRARMGWSPDVFGMYDNLTAREYLEFFAAAYRLTRAAARSRATELLELARLGDYGDQPVHVLSRGQKQRLALTRALVHRPAVLLLDEPAAGLDPHSRVELRLLLRRLAAEGAAVLISSHILSDLEEMADRVVFVDQGVTVGEHHVADLPVARRRSWRIRALDRDALVAALAAAGHWHGPAGTSGQPGPSGPSGVSEPSGGSGPTGMSWVDVELESEQAAADLLARLVGAGVPVTAFAPAGGTLEAAYLELVDENAPIPPPVLYPAPPEVRP